MPVASPQTRMQGVPVEEGEATCVHDPGCVHPMLPAEGYSYTAHAEAMRMKGIKRGIAHLEPSAASADGSEDAPAAIE